MFLWISLDLLKHPRFQSLQYKDADAIANGDDAETSARGVETKILSRALENGVQVTQGSLFDTGNEVSCGTSLHFRLTYAAALDEAELEEGIRKFASAVREEFALEEAC